MNKRKTLDDDLGSLSLVSAEMKHEFRCWRCERRRYSRTRAVWNTATNGVLHICAFHGGVSFLSFLFFFAFVVSATVAALFSPAFVGCPHIYKITVPASLDRLVGTTCFDELQKRRKRLLRAQNRAGFVAQATRAAEACPVMMARTARVPSGAFRSTLTSAPLPPAAGSSRRRRQGGPRTRAHHRTGRRRLARTAATGRHRRRDDRRPQHHFSDADADLSF